jgi:tRNA (guanine26-N2/guanine27-N2)-dimethyltransferase
MRYVDFKPDFPTETISEGKVKVVVPKLKAYKKLPCDYAPSKAPVFYNPVMELNRDLAVLALQAHKKLTNHELRICEPLTASGLRGIRFAAEVEGLEMVVMGDINERAFKLAQHNIALNKLARKVEVKNEEANYLLSSYSAPHKRFDCVDIDPFGSPVHFLDSAVRALRDGGLLAVTATDMAPLCGVHPRACIRKYGGKPLRAEYCHELAVRLVAGSMATAAAKHDMGVRVIFAHQAEHYVRVYSTVKHGAKNADESLANMGYVLHCFKCFHREIVGGLYPFRLNEKCSECGSKLSLGGPMWVGKLFDPQFCGLMKDDVSHRKLKLSKRIEKMLAPVESEADAPVSYFVIDKLCDAMSLPVPSVRTVIESVKSHGSMAWLTAFHSRGIKSDMPASGMKEIIRLLVESTQSRRDKE